MQLSIEEKERYSRHIILTGFGEEAQLKLKKARVLVIGAGGLGCPALLYLAAAGVGFIGIADYDVVTLSNLQRQILYTVADIGTHKAIAASKQLSLLNNEIHINTFIEKVSVSNVFSIIEGYDLIIDGSDNFSTRYLLNDACAIKTKPLVYGAIFKYEGQVSVFNLEEGPTYRCLFPSPPNASEILSCNEIGVLGILPGIVGAWQAAEAIKVITGIGQPLKGALMSFDVLNNQANFFKFSPVATNKSISQLGEYDFDCSIAADEIDAPTLKLWLTKKPVQLIDVREPQEYDEFNIGGRHFPLSGLHKRLQEIDHTKLTVVHCQTGVRSKKGIDIIKTCYPDINIFNLKNGLKDFA